MSHRRAFASADDFIEPEREEQGALLASESPEDDDVWSVSSDPYRKRYPRSGALLHPDSHIPKSCMSNPARIALLVAVVVVVVGAMVLGFRDWVAVAWLRATGVPPGMYSEEGGLRVGGRPVHLKGVSWYGMEEPQRMPGGLAKVGVGEVLDFVEGHRFNAVRLPLSVENVEENAMGHTHSFLNPELAGLLYLDVVRHVVRKAAERNVLVLLDMHRLQASEVQSAGVWYSDAVSEERVAGAWRAVCEATRAEWNVLGADVYNEPWDAEWGAGGKGRDWKAASERLGEVVHERCPSWMVVVQGVGNRAGGTNTGVFWAENLAAMGEEGPRLGLRKKVALSPHVYGPSVFEQDYFQEESFAESMEGIWEDHFGRASEKTGMATVVGEWGGWFKGKDQEWQKAFYKYLRKKEMSWFYWCLNPESADTGGLLKDDWVTPDKDKLELLKDAPASNIGKLAVHFKLWRNWRVG